jgi:hypothetical protein
MTWKFAMEYARQQAIKTGRKWYVQGYKRSHNGLWRYGVYMEKQSLETLRRKMIWSH